MTNEINSPRHSVFMFKVAFGFEQLHQALN